MASPFLIVVIILSLVTHSSKSALVALSKNEDGEIPYSTNYLGLVTEISGMISSFLIFKHKERKDMHVRKVFSLKDILFMSIPAWFVCISDHLYFYLVHVLNDELVVQAFSSLEIVVIGIASYVILGRELTGIHWSAIFLLCTSITSIQLESGSIQTIKDFPVFSSFVALLCAGLEGLQGVLKEIILKRFRSADVFQVNTWLCFWGAVVQFIFAIIESQSTIIQEFTFTNFNLFAFLLIISNTIKELCGNLILRYTDSIIESFVHCGSLVIASVLISILLSRQLSYPFIYMNDDFLKHSFLFIIAILNLCIATILYESAPEPQVSKSLIHLPSESKVADSIEID